MAHAELERELPFILRVSWVVLGSYGSNFCSINRSREYNSLRISLPEYLIGMITVLYLKQRVEDNASTSRRVGGVATMVRSELQNEPRA